MFFRLLLMLAIGVYVSSVFKDFCCSPRPFAPPVTRLSKCYPYPQHNWSLTLFFAAIGSHHLEYGFPSTHSTNSVSIALFLYDLLHRAYYPAASVANSTVDPSWLEWNATSGLLPAMEAVAEAPATDALISRTTYILGIGVLLFYVFSIVYGRFYTGMHSFTDCAVGIALGAGLWSLHALCGTYVDAWVRNNGIIGE